MRVVCVVAHAATATLVSTAMRQVRKQRPNRGIDTVLSSDVGRPRSPGAVVCDHFHTGSVRDVMVSLVLTAYTDTINCGLVHSGCEIPVETSRYFTLYWGQLANSPIQIRMVTL